MMYHKLKTKNYCLTVILFFAAFYSSKAQLSLPGGVSGAFQMDVQSYKEDSLIGAPFVPEKIDNNGYLDLKFNSGNFKAGLRYEAYLYALQGYDSRYKGTGITNRYAGYTYENLEITAGNFYEQFGSGMIFRSYYDYDLGYDNAMDGLLLKYNQNGVYVKGFMARQRAFFEYGPGLVRGIDGEIHLNELLPSVNWGKNNIIIGGSFVSRFQKDDSPIYKYPENVGASAARLNYIHGPFNLYAEYAYKINDPSLVNGRIYKPGEALFITAAYSKKGFGINAAAKRIDNMSFRSDRNSTGNVLNLNYLPCISKNQTYRLATLYPNATQPNGEMGLMGEVFYTFKPGTKLGGKHGTSISVNASQIDNIATTPVSNDTLGYASDFFKVGHPLYYQDINFEISKKINKKVKVIATYINQIYNQEIIEGHPDSPMVYTNIGVLDVTYKFTTTKSLRMEIQALWTKEDRGNWLFALAEFTIAPHWSFIAYDEYNYGNNNPDLRFHFLNGAVVLNKGVTRIALGYGKQRSGLLCVGGVCRFVPASNGATFSISTSF